MPCLTAPALAGLLVDPDVTVIGSGVNSGVGGTIDVDADGTESGLHWDTPVPSTFTFEWAGTFNTLPDNFVHLSTDYIFLGATDQTGPSVGLYVSKQGLSYSAYKGSPLYYLSNSEDYIQEGVSVTIRMAVDASTGITYIYITPTSSVGTIGHQLRYVMPTTLSSGVPVSVIEGLTVLARGTDHDVSLNMSEWCLLLSLDIPNLRPVADAGVDQAVRGCAIVRLDGTASFDPEGVPVLYTWRLTEAPQTSQYVRTGADGRTPSAAYPPGTLATDRFFSATFGTTPATAGEVLVVGGVATNITGTGTDGTYGPYVDVDEAVIPVGLLNATYLVLEQTGINGAGTSNPTFYPDAPGIYKFGLIVSDGDLVSSEDIVLLNVTESPIPRGIIPDLRFMWNFLSDVWGLVENRERIETFWSAFAQCAAAELLNLWQIDYNKSLRDIQRTVQRKWLHYDPLLAESLVDLASLREVWSGLDSSEIASAGANVTGQKLEVTFDKSPGSVSVTFTGANPISPASIAAQVRAALSPYGFTVTEILNRTTNGVIIRIWAPFQIARGSTTTTSLWPAGPTGIFSGSAGVSVSPKTYRADKSLQGMGIQSGDLLIIGSDAYKIVRLLDDASDKYPYQRAILSETLPLIPSATWKVASVVTSKSLDFWSALVTPGDFCRFEVTTLADGDVDYVDSTVLAAYAGNTALLAVDHAPLGEYLARTDLYEVRFFSCHRKTYIPVDPLVVDVPYLQVQIKESPESSVLRRNVDFFIDTFRDLPCIRFDTRVWETYDGASWVADTTIPDRLWAETTYLDNSPTIEGNFGVLVDMTRDQLATVTTNIDYLSAVRGLWFTYLRGPTIYNIRVGTQILLGLPFAEETGTIEEIRVDTGAFTGSILIKDSSSSEIVRSYTFPVSLGLETNPSTGVAYAVGDTIQQFAPIVKGVDVLDYVKDPTWFEGYLNQGVFYELNKFFKFLVRVDSEAFSFSSLSFIQSFIKRIKPSYTYPIFVVSIESNDSEISTSDTITATGYLQFHDGTQIPNFGAATMFDEPDASGGGWRSAFDESSDPSAIPPVPPTPHSPEWGFDDKFLYPGEGIEFKLTEVHGAGFTPSASSFWETGRDVFLMPNLVTPITWDYVTPQVAGTYVTFRTIA